jgi:hypothetical protein
MGYFIYDSLGAFLVEFSKLSEVSRFTGVLKNSIAVSIKRKRLIKGLYVTMTELFDYKRTKKEHDCGIHFIRDNANEEHYSKQQITHHVRDRKSNDEHILYYIRNKEKSDNVSLGKYTAIKWH